MTTVNDLDNALSSDSSEILSREAEVLSRETEVLGDGPRIAPLKVDQMSDELLTMVMNMQAVNQALDSRSKGELAKLVANNDQEDVEEAIQQQLAKLPEIMSTMLHHPKLFERQTEIGLQLLGSGALKPRERELAVLRIGWLCRAPYEWGEHVYVAKSLGISSEDIERITQGSSAPEWSELERAILQAVEELHGNAMISDATWNILRQHFNEQQLIELPILVGQYQTVAYYQNSLRLQLHEGNLGLKAR